MSNAFAPIVRARPCPIFGRPVHQGSLPLITARYFSSNPSDSGSLRTPCPPRNHEKDGFRFVLAVSGFRLRARLDFSIPSFLSTASEALPPLLDTAPLIRAPRGLQPP